MSLITLPETTEAAATNMAIDVSLLYSVPDESAIFRHYGWSEPSVTFGYTQRIDEVKTVVPKDINLCRRITGGGIVDHRNDWTYALVLHANLNAAHIPATELYARIHRSIQQTLSTQSIETQLAPCPRTCNETPLKPATAGPSQCFVLPAANDVLHPNGTKIAGAAMKRTRQGLLVQGSINRSSLPEKFNFRDFSSALPKSLAQMLDLNLTQGQEDLLQKETIQQQCQRFESPAWINRR